MELAAMNDSEADARTIHEIIHRQFERMTWTAGGVPDVAKFKNDFLSNAALYPSARPVAEDPAAGPEHLRLPADAT